MYGLLSEEWVVVLVGFGYVMVYVVGEVVWVEWVEFVVDEDVLVELVEFVVFDDIF